MSPSRRIVYGEAMYSDGWPSPAIYSTHGAACTQASHWILAVMEKTTGKVK